MQKTAKPIQETSVLIVEDEPRLRSVLIEGVRECGFQANGVRSGEEAMYAVETTPCDIAILDLNLPSMDGLQCFAMLKERWPDMAVLILTGFGTLEAAQRAIRLGVVEFLTKPASLGDLEQALYRAWQSLPACAPAGKREDDPESSHAASNVVAATTRRSLRDLEFDRICVVLDRHGGNREAAAAELGISVRKLYYRLSEYRRQDAVFPPE